MLPARTAWLAAIAFTSCYASRAPFGEISDRPPDTDSGVASDSSFLPPADHPPETDSGVASDSSLHPPADDRPPETDSGVASDPSVPPPMDTEPSPPVCSIVGVFRTNAGNVSTITFSDTGTYDADDGAWIGWYTFDGVYLELTPGGGTSAGCASQSGMGLLVTFDPYRQGDCDELLLEVARDDCTGLGLLSQTRALTRN